MHFNPILILVWILIGCLTAYVADQKGRDGRIWFAIGLFLGFLGLLTLFLLPSIKQEVQEVKEEPLPQSTFGFQKKDWFYLDEERNQTGPVGFNALINAWKENKINESSYIWSEGMDKWSRVNELTDIKAYLETQQ